MICSPLELYPIMTSVTRVRSVEGLRKQCGLERSQCSSRGREKVVTGLDR